ncbi:MAG: Nitrogen regulatory protein P-II [Syntrophomonadaceae bacterium]|nr:Nitrogen regulatory protein P-II [Bacillota bacterium]
MKEIMAIIRINKVEATKKALVEAGFNGLTASKAMGRGKVLVDLALLSSLPDEIREAVKDTLLKRGKLLPKRLITMAVREQEVKKAVETIIQANKEGNTGDGKIFVLPLLDAISVRTGEQGESAI